MSDHVWRIQGADQVLDCLLKGGVFNHQNPNMLNAVEEASMIYAAVLSKWLLFCIEDLEH